jgi:general stress protein 26
MTDALNSGEGIKKLADLVREIPVAMLTTRDQDGSLRSRPMMTQKTEFVGDLWFFTQVPSAKTSEIRDDEQVNVSFADAGKNVFVSISGRASIVRDPQRARKLWNPTVVAWFPDGPDDANLALVRVTAEKAEYWDSLSGNAVSVAL